MWIAVIYFKQMECIVRFCKYVQYVQFLDERMRFHNTCLVNHLDLSLIFKKFTSQTLYFSFSTTVLSLFFSPVSDLTLFATQI